ncbi:TPA: type VI secretion system tip protein VgrG [Escherichia coli]|nr:type VI secretion system tip protein VgrG [Escherichia coli]
MDIPTLNFDHSHHKLKIRGLKSPADVLTFTGHEQLSSPFRYDIEFTSTNKAITPESVLMQDGAFSLTAPPVQGMPVQTALRTLHGVITSFKHLSSSQDEARYEVRLEPRMALLTRSRQNAIYQNQTVPQIVEKILRERHQMRGQDFVFNLKNEYPAREQVMQYGEDDLTFVSRLLSEVGIWFRFATDARLKIEVVEFYDDQSGYERGLTLPLRHPSGLFDGETEAVWGLNSAYSVVEKSVSTRDYNYREATAEMTTGQHDATGGDNTTYGEAYHYADNFLQKGDKEAAESGAFYARIRHERYLNEQAILQGQSTSSLLMPGLEIKVQGDDAPAVFRKGVLITGVTASAARDRSYELTFTAIPYSERYGYRPALIPCPVMAGTLPARVTSTVKNDIYAHIDKDGRYRVNLDFDRDTWKPGLIYVAVYILLMLIVWMAGEYFEITNFLQLVLTWSLLIILSCGVGLIFMVVGKTFPEMQKVLPILLKPLYFISCIMFPLHSIPKQYWSYLLWNPLVHVVELSREAVMPGYISEGVSLNYLAMFTLVTLFIGLALYRTREEAMLTS